MAIRRVDGTALLVAAHGAPGAALDASTVHTLGQIGEALLATGAAWQIRRLTATSGERYGVDRAALKRHIDELVAEPARVAVVVLVGAIIDTAAGPAIVTGPDAQAYPDDATLPLAWIRQRLNAAKAEQVVVVLSASGDRVPRAWLDVLATERDTHVIAVERAASGHPAVDALLTGLCGDALDARTGTVTMASLADYLAKATPGLELQGSTAAETVAQPPPLAGFWDVRRSQLPLRRPRAGGDTDDLTGTVLPGRFRIDGKVARGTFGTVYRARQLAVERDVAIKVLHQDIDPSSEDGRLFVHEIRSVGRLDHANVVRIHQADITQDGRLFFAMELLDGRDLQELGANGPLPRERAVALVCQLLAGLGAAHEAGLVHADVKPANAILVGKDDNERVVLVDFGLSRLRAPDRPTASAGGTPAYMAPEQLQEGRVDARSDLFSAALVLVYLLTGWRRPNAYALVPPFDIISDADLREVIVKALDPDPRQRYASARELAAALTGSAALTRAATEPEVAPQLPFRLFAPLTEHDRGRLHGRETDLATLTEHALFRRSVIYTAPSGTGKTSLLRAGLVPRLEGLGIHAVYVRCRVDSASAVADAIFPNTTSIPEAIGAWHEAGGGKLVLVLDQLEAALGDPLFVHAVLAFDVWPPGADVAVVLSVREDFLARLVGITQRIEPGMPIVRLPPLAPAGARDAIIAPLTEARLAIEPELLDVLLEDLARAAAAIGPEMGWGGVRAVYPPHLQLACSVLFDALGSGEATLTLAHYQKLGGFDAIVGEHLERVVDTELADGRDVVARDLFMALVTTAHERAVRAEAELIEIVGARHGAPRVTSVLELLRQRGLLVRVRGDEGDASWELVHDSLIPRVLAWIDRKDLARRRAIELVRYHLRRSQPTAPSLLGRDELRELRSHAGAIKELEAEWQGRGDTHGWTPMKLVRRSRSALRQRAMTVAAIVTAALALGGTGMYRSHLEEERAREQERLRAVDLGRVTLVLEAFDWDPERLEPRWVSPAGVELRWQLHAPDPGDPRVPGEPYREAWLVRGTPRTIALPAVDLALRPLAPRMEHGLVEAIEARGGPAFLVVERGPCPPSTIPIAHLPGFLQRAQTPPVLHVKVPTCAASRSAMIEIPGGDFVFGGPGDPPAPSILAMRATLHDEDDDNDYERAFEKRVLLPTFFIDRTEVSNAAFRLLSTVMPFSGIAHPTRIRTKELKHGLDPRKPIVAIDAMEARAFCAYMGKRLPTSAEWQKALRGGLVLPDGSPNPMPNRNYPWGTPRAPVPAKIDGVGEPGALEVGSMPDDVSPYGVLDLAGNVLEWTSTTHRDGGQYVRGAGWSATTEELVDYLAIENQRKPRFDDYATGMRCVADPWPGDARR